MKPEAKVRDATLRRLRRTDIDFEHYRNHMGRGVRTGRPDDLFLFPDGLSVWIEFKAPGRGPTELQAEVQKRMKELGQNVFTCDSADSAFQAFAQAMDRRSDQRAA